MQAKPTNSAPIAEKPLINVLNAKALLTKLHLGSSVHFVDTYCNNDRRLPVSPVRYMAPDLKTKELVKTQLPGPGE